MRARKKKKKVKKSRQGIGSVRERLLSIKKEVRKEKKG